MWTQLDVKLNVQIRQLILFLYFFTSKGKLSSIYSHRVTTTNMYKNFGQNLLLFHPAHKLYHIIHCSESMLYSCASLLRGGPKKTKNDPEPVCIFSVGVSKGGCPEEALQESHATQNVLPGKILYYYM